MWILGGMELCPAGSAFPTPLCSSLLLGKGAWIPDLAEQALSPGPTSPRRLAASRGGAVEPQGDSAPQNGLSTPTPEVGPTPGLPSGYKPWGMVMCLGRGWAKGPGHPEGFPHPLQPIWPHSDHQALTTQGACPPPISPDLRPAQGLQFAVLIAGQILCGCVCVPVTRSFCAHCVFL